MSFTRAALLARVTVSSRCSSEKVQKPLRQKRLQTGFKNAFLRLPRRAGTQTPLTPGGLSVLVLTALEGLVVMYGEYHNLASDGIGVSRIKPRVEVPLPPDP